MTTIADLAAVAAARFEVRSRVPEAAAELHEWADEISYRSRSHKSIRYADRVLALADELGTPYVRTRADTPEWVTDLIREAHGKMLPDDIRYALIRDALYFVADQGENADEFAESVTVNCADPITWLGSHSIRVAYVDDAEEEYGRGDHVMASIAMGIYAEAHEVFASVVESLRDHLASVDDDAEATS